MVSRSLVATLAGLGAGACASDALDPDAAMLLGHWGGADAELIALRAGAELRLGCDAVLIPGGIPVAVPGPAEPAPTFTVTGQYHRSGVRLAALPRVTVTGTLRGRQVTVTTERPDGQSAVTLELTAGVGRVIEDVPTCPL